MKTKTTKSGNPRQEQKNLDEMSNLVNDSTLFDSKYEIKREIARGGMGIVYEAYHTYAHKRVAIKVILADKVDPIQVKRFQKEIEAYSLLSHPNVITIYDAGVYNKYPYIVMEYIEGVDICTYVKQHKEADWKLCAKLVYEAALGLEYIHSKKMIHRDIKPSNIIVRPNGNPVIIDLGLVKFERIKSYNLTKSREIIGTIEYMPIEQAKGEKSQIDARTDVYSLGLVLYELLTGTKAYDGKNIMELCYKIISYHPPLPRKINPEIPQVLEEITIHATEKQKEKRYASAKEFANALKKYLDEATPNSKLHQKNSKIITYFTTYYAKIQYKLGNMYYEGKGVKQNFEKAFYWYTKFATQNLKSLTENIVKSQYRLAGMYEQGKGIKQDFEKAFYWYEKAALQGHSTAQYKLGLMYYDGTGVEQDFEKAFYWYEKAALQGHSMAQYKLGVMYAKGKGVEQDFENAFELFEKAAIQDNVTAQYKLGNMYAKGKGIKQDFENAVHWYITSAIQGHEDAQYKLGNMYAKGQGVTQNFENAVHWYITSAIQGNVEAQYKLGLMYSKGQGVKQNIENAVYWYEKAANQGHALAQCNLGLIYYEGKGIPQDFAKALVLFEQSANQDLAKAQYSLGVMYAKGYGVTKDFEKAIDWLKKAKENKVQSISTEATKVLEDIKKQNFSQAENQLIINANDLSSSITQDNEESLNYEKRATLGNANDQFWLGFMYEQGKGVPQDFENAFYWYEKAAIQGHAKAQYNLGFMYYEGKGVPQDFKNAFYWYEKATIQGHAKAQYNLATMYYEGKSVKKDFSKAFELFEQSSNQDYAKAQYNLGVMYKHGEGVEQDFSKAFALFEQSANQNYAKSQYNLGLMYKHGEGVAQDFEKAFYWYEKAAIQGHAKAQYNLGLMYKKGENGTQDIEKAIDWLKKAKENNDPKISLEATKILEDIEK